MKETTKANCSLIHKYLCIRIRFFFESLFISENQKKRKRKVVNVRGIVFPPFSRIISRRWSSPFFSRDRETIEARRDPEPRSSVSGSFSSPPSPLSRRAYDLAITWLDHESWNPLSRGGDSSNRVPLFLLLSLPLSRYPVSRCSLQTYFTLISFWGNGPFSRQ